MPTARTFKRLVPILAADAPQATVPTEIELLRTGEWNTPWHGHFEVTPEDLIEYKQHFDDGLRKGVPIDLEHNSVGGAVGWIEALDIRDTVEPEFEGQQSLWASQVDWTPTGIQKIKDREYRFFSPEFADEDYEDPEHAGQFYDNVLIGGGLTNRPLFKNLTPVAASDGTGKDKKSLTPNHNQNILYLSEDFKLDLQELLAKDTADLTAEEKAFIVENKADLTDEQVTALTEAGVLEAEGSNDDNDNAGDGGSNDDDDDNEGAGDGAGDETPEAKAAREAAEKAGFKVISASQLKKLEQDAAAGKSANERLERREVEEKISGMCFNEKTGGKLPVAAKDQVTNFYLSLSPNQRKAFDGIVEKMPSLKMFGEAGDAGGSDIGSVREEVKTAAEALIKKAKEDNKVLTYGAAVKQVLASDKALAERYNSGEEQ